MPLDLQISKNYPLFISQGLAPCSTADPEVFFPQRGSNGNNIKLAKKVCQSCPYISPCLEWALVHKESGIWGKTTETERKRISRLRKCNNNNNNNSNSSNCNNIIKTKNTQK